MRKPELGNAVVYCDSKGVDHDALVTAVWSETCCNVVFVSDDESRTDTYGRQVERQTSCTHAAVTGQAHGNYWRHADEPRNPVKPPLAV